MRRLEGMVLVVAAPLLATAALAAGDQNATRTVDAIVRIDALGRPAIVYDDWANGRDGLADGAYVLLPHGPMKEAPGLPRFMPGALLYTSAQDGAAVAVHLQAHGAQPFEWLLTVDDPRAVGLLWVGARRLWPDAAAAPASADGEVRRPTLADARTDHLTGVTAPPSGGDPIGDGAASANAAVTCQNGGPGATHCSAQCQGHIFGLTIGDNCSVSCTEQAGLDVYACCGCGGFLQAFGSCTCQVDLLSLLKSLQREEDPRPCPACP